MTTQPAAGVPLQHLPQTASPLYGTHFISQTPSTPNNTMIDEENYPWQYQGYPGFSAWMASDVDFFLLRRFSKVNARYLLYLQHEIGKRERWLDEWDALSKHAPPGKEPCGSFETESHPERTRLIEELGPLLQRYYDLVNAYAQVRSKPTAEAHHLRNLKNWFITNPDAIVEDEQHFKVDGPKLHEGGELHDGELFQIIGRPKTPLRWLLHKSRALRFLFPLKPRSNRLKSSATRYHSDIGFDNMVCGVTVTLGLGLLFAPMWCLHYVSNVDDMLGIITGFVALFTMWLYVAAGPRQFEILLGTAAYAAVLYIYLQASNGGPQTSNP